MFRQMALEKPELIAQYFRNSNKELQQVNYEELYKDVLSFSLILSEMGVKKESLVGILAENSREWAVTDLAVLALRAADVPRGRDITDKEIEIIFGSTQCEVVAVEKAVDLQRVLTQKKALPDLKHLIVMDPDYTPEKKSQGKIKIHHFSELLKEGREKLPGNEDKIEYIIDQGEKEDLATIIFTSGTTGVPKGVMLTQHNYLNHAESLVKRIRIQKGQIWLTILPVWHSFERCIQYVVYCNGLSMAYSKPIGAVLLQDFKDIGPHYTTAVPRIWESVYNSIQKKVKAAGGIKKMMFAYFTAIGSAYVLMKQMVRGTVPRFKWRSRILDFMIAIIPLILLWPGKKLGDLLVFKNIKAIFGKNFKTGISGGGSLQNKIDRFFAAADITLLEGYGLTESGPVISVRTEWKPEVGTVGCIFPNMQIRILNEQGKECKPGEKGVLYAKGCQIMKGYFKNPEKTREVLSEDGWLNTGDLAICTHDNTIAIVGREKDTIVLLGGENIEPVPIEKNLSSHPMIDNIVVVGQDQKYLGALMVPNMDALKEYADDAGLSYSDMEELIDSPEIIEYYRGIIVGTINSSNGFRSFEQIFKFKLLKKPFEVNRELSAKQELKRHKINELYAEEIASLF